MENLNFEQKIYSPSAPAINGDYGVPGFKMLPVAAPAAPCHRMLQACPSGGSPLGITTCEPFHPSMPAELNTNMWMCENKNKKRLQDSYEPINFVSLEGLTENPFNVHQQSCASTALHLGIQGNLANSIDSTNFSNITPNNTTICFSKNLAAAMQRQINATEQFNLTNSINSSNFDSITPNHSTICASKILAAEIQRQNDATEQFIRLEGGRTRQRLLEMTESHCKALLCSAALTVSWKLREKGLELLRMNRKNMELEEQIRGLTIESRAWQKRAKCCQEMAVALQRQIEEVNKEGSGDSEEEAFNAAADISASSCQIIHSTNNNNSNSSIYTNIYIENRELKMQRSCRLCRSKEVRMLVLPCRHLCLCKHCDAKLDVCPLCSALKTASVEVQTS